MAHPFLKLAYKLLVIVEHLSELTPAFLQLIILLRDRDLRLIRMVDNGHSRLQFAVQLLLSGLQDRDTCLQLDFLVFSLVHWHTGIVVLGAR